VPFRVAIFSAVSTEAQATEDKASLDVQLEQCRAVCAARGWTIARELRVEGHSRAYNWLHQLVTDCPEYGELVRLVESEAVDLVVVRDYDRLWRTDALRGQLMALCREHGAQVFSCSQPVEPVAPELLADSDAARLSEIMFGFVAEQESRTRVRRCKAGIEQGRIGRRGLHHSSTPIYGYQRGPTPDSPMQPIEPAASHVRWLFERRAEGWAIPAIAKSLNERHIPSPEGLRWLNGTLTRLLASETYQGVAHWGAARNESGAHPAIIDADLWARVQAVNRLRTSIGAQKRGPFLLTRLVKCGHCGHACGYSPTHAGHYYVRCNLHARHIELCTSNSWRADALEAHVLAEVKAALSDPAAWEAARRESSGNGQTAARIATLDGHLADARTRLGRWDTLYESGGITANELLLHRQEIRGQIETVSAERSALAETQRALASGAAHLAELAAVAPLLDSLAREDLRAVIRTLVACVRIYELPTRRIAIDWL